MKKGILLLLAATALCGEGALAQRASGIKMLEAQGKFKPAKHSAAAKATATMGSRVIAGVTYEYDGLMFMPTDSVALNYSGSRGGDLNSMQIKYDNGTAFTYNPSTGTYRRNIYVTQGFDSLDNVISVTGRTWDTTTSAWVNSYKNMYTYTGTTLNSEVYQEWDESSSSWVNSNKYLYTYESGNLVTYAVQNWNSSTSSWVNSYQYTYTYDGSDMTAEYFQMWNSSTSAFENVNRTLYTYEGGNLASEVSSNWNSSTSMWENSGQTLYTYNSMNYQIAALHKTYDASSSSFVITSVELDSMLTSNGQPGIQVFKDYDASSSLYTNAELVTNTYNSYNQLTYSYTQSWNAGGFWQSTTGDPAERYYYEEYTLKASSVMAKGGDVRIYPVPASNVVNIDLSWNEPQSFTLAIYDMQGRIVMNQSEAATTNYHAAIPVSKLPAGNYLVKITGTKGQMLQQLVVANK